MSTPTFPKLAVASIAVHFADQMMLALLPLVLVEHGAEAQTVSLVVAAHAAAWLLVSLPTGAFADAISRRTIMSIGALTILAGSCLGGTGLAAHFAPPWLLALSAFTIAAGVVMLILSVFALVPKAVESGRLASANALLEFGRAATAIASPFVAAMLVTQHADALGFALAFVGGVIALAATRALPLVPALPSGSVSILQSIRDGARFVVQDPILRAIALCALAWNSAFFALAAVFAPFAVNDLGMSIAEIGNVWSLYGIGLLFGSLAAAPMISRLPTGFMFIFGPLTSVVAVAWLVMSARPGATGSVYVGFFALGFGPMTWLVLQTSVRQIVTPNALLGRVGATITTTIYGIRPIGALVAGAMAANFGARAAALAVGHAVCWFVHLADVVASRALACATDACLIVMTSRDIQRPDLCA